MEYMYVYLLLLMWSCGCYGSDRKEDGASCNQDVDIIIMADCSGLMYVERALHQYCAQYCWSHKVALVVYNSDKVLYRDLTMSRCATPSDVSIMCDDHAPYNVLYNTYTCPVTTVTLERTFNLLYRVLSPTTDDVTNDHVTISKTRDTHVVVATSSSNVTEDVLHTHHLIDLILPSNVALHLYIDSNIEHLTTNIGKPGYSVTYKDGSHFNKALTLARLLRDSVAQTYQGVLLARGTHVEVCDIGDIIINPLLWSPLDVGFKNICDDRTCAEDLVCSPLHGCLQHKDLDNHLPSNTSSSLPLPSFSTNHADLATSNNTMAVSGTSHQLSMTDTSGTHTTPLMDTVIMTTNILQWDRDKPFVSDIISRDDPVVLKNTVVAKWPALEKWNMTYLAQNMGMDTLPFVKCSDTYLTFDPDSRAPLKLDIPVPYDVHNMSTQDFFHCVDNGGCRYKGYYYFGSVPAGLKQDMLHDDYLYHTHRDYTAQKQYMWISSPGMITHAHFDQDYNMFVQVVGKKRFTFWSPWQHDMLYVYPRVHPLWHKSRINIRHPDTSRFPHFKHSKSTQVVLEPGDVLYVPPYTWHYVETLSTSVSLSTWSHDYHVYDNMNAIYGHDHKFDLIADPKGQLYSLRLYLDLLVQHLYGYNETTPYMARLLMQRYNGLEHLFPPRHGDQSICPTSIPTCYHVHGYVKLDSSIVGGHFKALPLEVMDQLFMDYVEEIAAQVVGADRVLAFFRYCFTGQSYHLTDINDQEHTIWDYIE